MDIFTEKNQRPNNSVSRQQVDHCVDRKKLPARSSWQKYHKVYSFFQPPDYLEDEKLVAANIPGLTGDCIVIHVFQADGYLRSFA
jgi:hypothetical protein